MIFNPEFRAALRQAYEPKPRKRQRSSARNDTLLLSNSAEQGPAQQSPQGDSPEIGDDPDERTSPDDCRLPSLPVSPPPPPEQPESWWSALVFGPTDAPVSPQDAFLALDHVAYRLGHTRSAYGNSHITLGSTPLRADTLTPPETVGELHAVIKEVFGPPGWGALMQCWHEAAGIELPKRQRPPALAAPATELASKPDGPLPLLPANAPLLEEGLHAALGAMPERVAAFLLHVPRDPPAWRYRESEAERSQRQALEDIGGWSG